jgi:hypothetical protein
MGPSILRFRMEERPPVWRVAANILNKQSRTADNGWSSSISLLWNIHRQNLGPGLILWYDLSNERETWDEVTGEWRKLHNEELHDLYSSPTIVQVMKSRRMKCAGYVACMGEGRGVYRDLVEKLEGKRPLGRPRRRWEDNIKADL